MFFRTALFVFLTFVSVARSQQPDRPTLRLEGVLPVGPRASVTESGGTLQFELSNLSDTAREARLVVFYAERSDEQFGRDVWVPPRSTVSSWLTVGPASAVSNLKMSREMKFQLYERVEGTLRLILPSGDDRLRSRSLLFRKREPSTCLVVDEEERELPTTPDLTSPLDRTAAVVQFARTYRLARGLSELLSPAIVPFLPPTADAYDGTDQVILAGNRVARDPIGLQAIRQWVMSGGTLWVMLDQVDVATFAPVLGDDFGFEVVNRTSLTSVRLARFGEDSKKVLSREFDHPVDFVRVRLGGNENVLYTTDGWPAAFSQQLGRGKVVFTTLGGRAWFRTRASNENRSGFENHPDLPVPLAELERFSVDVYPEPVVPSLKPTDLESILTSEIGYKVVGRETAGAILLCFVLGTIASGILLRSTRRPESIGWLAPLLAIVTAGAFVAFGLSSRRAVPATVSVMSVVDVSSGNREGNASGLAAIYRPDSGPLKISTRLGGLFEIDPSGLEGQPRLLVQVDSDDREWENLSLPVGVRVGPFHGPVRLDGVSAVVQFGPEGVTGVFHRGELLNPADSVLLSPAADAFGIRLQADGGFRAFPNDRLSAGEFLTDNVITDRQQRRREVYRKFLAPMPRYLAGRTHLLTWVDSTNNPVSVASGDRIQGTHLLVIPAAFKRTPPDSIVTIPAGFIPYGLAGPGKLSMESTLGMEQSLRFQLPESALPLIVERATLSVKVRAPGRTLSIHVRNDAGKQSIHESTNPLDAIRIEVTDRKLLSIDSNGGLRIDVAISNVIKVPGEVSKSELGWRIESLALEVVGRTRAK